MAACSEWGMFCAQSAFIAWICLASTTALALVPVTYRPVVVTGQQAPGTPTGIVFDGSWGFDDLTLDLNGRVAFRAKVSGPGIVYDVNEFGLWSDATGTLGKLAWAGEQAYDMQPGRTYWSFAYDVSQVAGTSAFKCITKPTNYRTGIWSGTPGNLSLTAAEDHPAFGMASGITYYDLGKTAMNPSGLLAVKGQMQGTGLDQWNNEAVWVLGMNRLVAVASQQAPGMPAGVSFWRFTEDPRINSQGRVVFRANLQVNKVSYYTDGIWTDSNGPLELVAVKSGNAPGTTAQYSLFWGDTGFNDIGQVCFTAKLTGAGITSLNENGLWVGSPGNVQLLARDGNLVPGRGTETFNTLTTIQPKICDTGQVVFRYGYGIGLCVGVPGNLSVIAHRDDQAPNLPAGVLFQTIATADINRWGDVAFKTLLKGTGVTTDNDQALWARVSGQTVLVIREGDQLAITPGVSKTVSSITANGYSGNQDGLPSVWNDNRQMAFIAGFTDGTYAVVVANVFANRGAVQADPILPTAPPGPDNQWIFDTVPGDGRWFDPTPASAYQYMITDGLSNFTRVGLPSGLNDADGFYTITDSINGTILVAAGQYYTFPIPVNQFTITGIDPAVDGDALDAFPTYLLLDRESVSFTMTALIPEPVSICIWCLSSWMLLRRRRG